MVSWNWCIFFIFLFILGLRGLSELGSFFCVHNGPAVQLLVGVVHRACHGWLPNRGALHKQLLFAQSHGEASKAAC